MTRENCERLLAHYEATENTEAYEDMLANMKARGWEPDKKSTASKKKDKK